MSEEMENTPSRTRTFAWEDPFVTASLGSTLSGFDFLTAMSRGEIPIPPLAHTLGLTQFPSEVAVGKVSIVFHPQEYHYNPIGTVHGGVISTLLDTASACAVHSMLPIATFFTSLEIKVNFIRALYVKTGEMRCEGSIISLGGRIAVAEAKLFDSTSKLYAHCTQTCLIMRENLSQG